MQSLSRIMEIMLKLKSKPNCFSLNLSQTEGFSEHKNQT